MKVQPSRWLTGLLFCLLGLVVMAALSACGPDEPDRKALIALYNGTSGEYWEDKEYWMSDAPLHKWANVTTNEEGRVTELLLAENGLNGEIPPELGDLTSLEVLDLGGGGFDWDENRLSGEIPPELGNLANLKLLDLSYNRFSGGIPPELGKLVKLEVVNLRSTGLSGKIPPEWANLPNLSDLDISGGTLVGALPHSLRGKVRVSGQIFWR